MWTRTVEGRVLTFRLIGINNQNFLMEDAETKTWWQQASGAAIHGPLTGKRLEPVLHDEVTFGLWQREYPAGRVLALVDDSRQIRKEWETRMTTTPVVVAPRPGDALEPRALVFGLVIDGQSKAYPKSVLLKARAVMDRIGATPVAILIGADDVSTRAFDRRLDGRTLDLLARPGASPARFIDGETGSEFDISGRAVSGPLAGRTLSRVPMFSDYWFDWRLYHPDTAVYREWQPPASTQAPAGLSAPTQSGTTHSGTTQSGATQSGTTQSGTTQSGTPPPAPIPPAAKSPAPSR